MKYRDFQKSGEILAHIFAKKCAEWGIKELSWAELGRRVGHKKLTGEGKGGER